MKLPKISLSATTLTLVSSLWMTIFANHSFWQLVRASQPFSGQWLLFAASLFAAITALHFGVIRLLGPGPLLRVSISLMWFMAAVASWFMDTYGVVIDAEMLRNALQTDVRESAEFIGPSLLWRITWQALLPMLLLWRVHITPVVWWRELISWALGAVGGFVMVLVVGMPQYKHYASFFRNHIEARSMIAPGNVIDAGVMLTNRILRARQPFVQVGLDAHRPAAVVNASTGKPLLVVMVVGETARAANFSLGGYGRLTNPLLAQRPVYYFTNTKSCGTATAISVPCMFSELTREEFDVNRAGHRDSVLDMLQRAGLQVLWVDNQSGCKGVCARVPNEFAWQYDGQQCDDENCHDELLLKVLDVQLGKVQQGRLQQDKVLVLHQMGSHGPAYYKRTKPEATHFLPTCTTDRIETCTTEQIVNAYDNTIVYTDQILAGLIDRLQQASDRIDSVLFYVSDHGESLGESGLFLHGQTYAIAPEVQKHVPMLLWFSPEAPARLQLNTQCLRERLHEPVSHDYVSHTLLGLQSVSTAVYRPELDLLSACRSNRS